MDREKIHASRFKRFIDGRGFYVALAACLLATGGIAVATFGETLFVSQGESNPSSQITRPVEQVVSGVPEDTTTTTQAPTTTTTTSTADTYVFPLGNTLLKPFSAGAPVYSETMKDWRTHDGADFVGENGQEVRALADGTVTEVKTHPLWGGCVTIDHGLGVMSHYYGVEPSVKKGSTVTVGRPIGALATSPCEAGERPHLHLEITVDGVRVDPVETIGREVRAAE